MTRVTVHQVQMDGRLTIPKEIVANYQAYKRFVAVIEREDRLEILPITEFTARKLKH